MKAYPKRYIPKQLSKKDVLKQYDQLQKSRRLYKQKKYHTRKKMASFKNKKSSHVTRAKHLYKVDAIKPSASLAKKTGCSINALREIERKGEGAYYSSGSRPNQTASSWGRARLASSITGGKSSAVDLHILEKGCKKNSRALNLARKMRGKGTRRVPKRKL